MKNFLFDVGCLVLRFGTFLDREVCLPFGLWLMRPVTRKYRQAAEAERLLDESKRIAKHYTKLYGRSVEFRSLPPKRLRATLKEARKRVEATNAHR